MSPLAAWIDGIRRVEPRAGDADGRLGADAARQPAARRSRCAAMLAQHLGASLAADTAASGVNYDWMQEFGDQAIRARHDLQADDHRLRRRARQPERLSRQHAAARRHRRRRGGLHRALDLRRRRHHRSVRARSRDARRPGSSPRAGVFFFRFLRLAVVHGVVYGVLFGALHPWLFDRLYPRLTHDVTVERTAFFAVASRCTWCSAPRSRRATMVFDYAKVRAVVEDRRSMLGAIGAAAASSGGITRPPSSLFLLNFGVFVAALWPCYGLVAPGAGRAAGHDVARGRGRTGLRARAGCG